MPGRTSIGARRSIRSSSKASVAICSVVISLISACAAPSPEPPAPAPADTTCDGDAVRLTVRLDAGGASILDAVIVRGATLDATAGGDGEIAVTDAAGRVLASAPLPEPRAATIILPDGEGGAGAMSSTGAHEIVMAWPADAVAVRLGEDVLTPGCPTLLGKADGGPRVTPLAETGASEARFDVVLLGDGYRAEERERFEQDARRFADALLAFEPYRTYAHLINVWAVFEASDESGAAHGRPGRGTAYGCHYGCSGIERLLCCEEQRALHTATAAVPSHDALLVLVNDARYGGAGGASAASTYNGPHMVDVGLHELGHQLGLDDEYVYVASSPRTRPGPNCADHASATPWEAWRGDEGVDAFEGCSAGDRFRATERDCLMQTLGRAYCPVCREHVVRSIHAAAHLIEEPAPSHEMDALAGGTELEISVSAVDPSTLRYQWWLDDAPLEGAGPRITVPCANGALRAVVSDPTPWVRSDPDAVLTESAAWSVACAEPTPTDPEPPPTDPEPPMDATPFGALIRPDAAIPDADEAGVVSELTVAGAPALGAVQIRVAIEHTYRGDLEIDAIAPDGSVYPLLARSYSDGRRDVYEAFDVPVGSDVPRDGGWQLRVRDVLAADVGTLRAWSIGVGMAAPALEP